MALQEMQKTQYSSSEMDQIRGEIHRRLMERINLRTIEKMEDTEVREQISKQVLAIIEEGGWVLNAEERTDLVTYVQNEFLGLGPIEPLLADSTVCDILVNTHDSCYVERHGVLEKTQVRFQSDEHLMRIIQKIASKVGRRIDESSPMVDARLEDGSRVNAIIPPLAIDGPILSIRKFAVDPLTANDLTNFRSISPDMIEFLKAVIKGRVNLIISGGTGSGKTTLLNVVSGFIPANERIVTIEDSAELQLQQPHVVRLETRPPNIENEGQVKQRDLVRNALRMRPDRIIIGEVRGEEALDMLQAMNTGHDGSLGTIHANSPRDALTRLEHMVGMSGVPIPPSVIRQQISAALDVLIHSERLPDGRRVIISIQEITGMEESVVNVQEIFAFKRKGIDQHGKIQGEFRATGIRPALLGRLRERGITFDETIFDPDKVFE